MILLCDEDVGTGVPTALRAVGYKAHSFKNLRWMGRPDVWWLAHAGDSGWLVLSCNKKHLKVARERRTIIDHEVGIVYLTTGNENPALVLKLLLNRWPKLELLHNITQRPFAYFLSRRGVLSDRYRDFRL